MYDDFADLPTQVMVRPTPLMVVNAPRPRQKSEHDFGDLPTHLINLSPEFLARVREIAPRRRFPKALLAFVASAALFAIPSVRATCGGAAHHMAQAVGSHVILTQ